MAFHGKEFRPNSTKIPTKEELQKLIDENKSTYEICNILGKSFGSIRHWLHKYDLKTNFKPIGYGFDKTKQKISERKGKRSPN